MKDYLPAPLYVASRASLAARPRMWQRLRAKGWPIVSTWIDETGEGETDDFTELWARIEKEVRAAAGLILYAEASDFPLKGALVEVGMAIGMGKPVAVVVPDVLLCDRHMRPLGSWAHHPLVTICNDLDQARSIVNMPPGADQESARGPGASHAG